MGMYVWKKLILILILIFHNILVQSHRHLPSSSPIRPAFFTNTRSLPLFWVDDQSSNRLLLHSWEEPTSIRQEIAYGNWGTLTDQLVLTSGEHRYHVMTTNRGVVVHDCSRGV